MDHCTEKRTAPQQPWWWATTFPNSVVSRAEFDALKRDVEELQLLVKSVKEGLS